MNKYNYSIIRVQLLLIHGLRINDKSACFIFMFEIRKLYVCLI